MQILQHRGLDVAAADDGYVQLGLGSSAAWKMNPATETAPLGSAIVSGFALRYFIASTDFFFRDGDDIVNVFTDVLKVDVADALGAKPVGQGAGDLLGGERDDFSGAEAGLGVGGEFGFDANHFYFGFVNLIAVATPLMRPPPPTGAKTASTSGISSRISSPMVPWPAMIFSSL